MDTLTVLERQLRHLPGVDEVRIDRTSGDTGSRDERNARLPIVTAAGVWGVAELRSAGAPLSRAAVDAAIGLIEVAAVALGLAERCAELNDSRLRLMAELDDAFIGIERELHGGVQQRLTTTGMELRLVRDTLPAGDPAQAALAEIGEQIGEMAAEMRELSRRTFPAILSDGGLGPALRSLARRAPLPVELDPARLPRYPALLESTVYQLVSDVVAHAARTGAGLVSVRIADSNGGLNLVAGHDGPGAGMLSQVVRDRVDALGATLDERTTPGGVTVRADFRGFLTG